MTHRGGPRLKRSDFEWMHRKLASLARDTEGTKEGQRWRHWHDWVYAELQRRMGEPEEPEPLTNGPEVKT